MSYLFAIGLAVGYCFGCIQTGFFVGKANHIDIREHGSGNSGATNALRTMGKLSAIITLTGDVLKSVIAIFIMRSIFADSNLDMNLIALYTGLGVVLGHNFPCWLKFKGGKGIAATAGVILSYDPRILGILLLVFLIVVATTKYVSLGSIILAIIYPILNLIFYPGQIHLIILCYIFSALALFRHRGNMKRLVHGTENKLGQRKA